MEVTKLVSDTTRLASLVNSVAEQLESGADLSLGFYLERPSYLSGCGCGCGDVFPESLEA